MVQAPGVVHRAVVGVVGGGAGREFLQVFLAQDDCAGVSAPSHDLSVLVGHVIAQYSGAQSGPDAARRDVVLDADGDAVQRAAVFSAREFFFGLFGLLHRLFAQDGYERVESGLSPVRLIQRGFREFHRGHLSRLDQRRDFGDGQFEQFVIRHRLPLLPPPAGGATT